MSTTCVSMKCALSKENNSTLCKNIRKKIHRSAAYSLPTQRSVPQRERVLSGAVTVFVVSLVLLAKR